MQLAPRAVATARANLAVSYRAAGRTDDAIPLAESVLADSERILGRDHPGTVAARRTLDAWRSRDP